MRRWVQGNLRQGRSKNNQEWQGYSTRPQKPSQQFMGDYFRQEKTSFQTYISTKTTHQQYRLHIMQCLQNVQHSKNHQLLAWGMLLSSQVNMAGSN